MERNSLKGFEFFLGRKLSGSYKISNQNLSEIAEFFTEVEFVWSSRQRGFYFFVDERVISSQKARFCLNQLAFFISGHTHALGFYERLNAEENRVCIFVTSGSFLPVGRLVRIFRDNNKGLGFTAERLKTDDYTFCSTQTDLGAGIMETAKIAVSAN